MYLNTPKYRRFCSLIESLSRICPACVASAIVSGSPMIAPCKGVRIPKSWNWCLWNGGILGFGIRNTAQGICNPKTIGIEIPSSTDEDWNPVPGIRNPRHWFQNPRLSWNPLHGGEWGFVGEAAIVWAKHSSLHRGLNTHWHDDPARQPRGLLGLLECVLPVL